MLCSECKQREATVHIVRVKGDEKVQMDLCPVCAEKYYGKIKGKMVFNQDASALFKAILANPQQFGIMFSKGSDDKTCPACGTTGRMIRKSGLAGCPECYRVFEEELQPIIDKVQKASVHCGYVPEGMLESIEKNRVIEALKKEIGDLIEQEEYEKAAEIRDRIRALEEKDAEPV